VTWSDVLDIFCDHWNTQEIPFNRNEPVVLTNRLWKLQLRKVQ
jgi:hypothetical protein